MNCQEKISEIVNKTAKRIKYPKEDIEMILSCFLEDCGKDITKRIGATLNE